MPAKKRPSTDELLRRWESDKKSRIFLQLADEYRRQDFTDAAIAVLREGLKFHPNFQPAHVALARCHVAKNELTEAQAELERVHAKSPDNILAGKLLAEVLEERGEKAQALEVLESVLPFAFDDPDVEDRVQALRREVAGPRVSASVPGAADTAEFGTSEFVTSSGESEAVVDEAPAPPEPPPPPAPEPPPAPVPPPLLATEAPPPALPEAPSSELPEAPSSELLDLDDAHSAPPPVPDAAATAEALVGASTLETAATAETSGPELDLGKPSAEAEEATTQPPVAEVAEPLGAPGEPFGGAAEAALPGADAGPPDDLLAPSPPPPAVAVEDEDLTTSVTLAELYEQQGAHDEAATIYERLLVKHPADADVRSALERCRTRLAGEAPAPVAEEVPRFAPEPPPAPAPAVAPVADAGAERWPAVLAEYERWLTAIRAVRQ